MRRRDFLTLMAASAGATALPLASNLAGATKLQTSGGSLSDGGSPTSFPVTDWDAVAKEGWGTGSEQAGPGTWDGVTLQAPPDISDLTGSGPFSATWDSLLAYDAPEWYRDAKFAIWAHWSPQCVPEDGDWYARNMYIQDQRQYQNQLARYGHPSVFGYKDLCAQWTLLNWEPDALIERYKNAGAKLFIALANHHDGFDAWNSKYHAWNAQNMGPHQDVIGVWAAAARKQGLRFGVTVHAARNWWWLQVSHLCDRTGPLAGVPYDAHLTLDDGNGQWWQGYDPQQLYCRKHGIHENPDEAYVRNFYDRVRDLIDQHDPDLLYFDNDGPPLGWAGMNIGAYFYNHNLKTRGGNLEAVLNVKGVPDAHAKAVVADYESGVTDRIMPYAWQSETCLGDWMSLARMGLSSSTSLVSPTGPLTPMKAPLSTPSGTGCRSTARPFTPRGPGRFSAKARIRPRAARLPATVPANWMPTTSASPATRAATWFMPSCSDGRTETAS